jgi:DNA-binding XRE family transcriptional regulator
MLLALEEFMGDRPGSEKVLRFALVTLGGVAYAIVPAATLAAVCRKAGIAAVPEEGAEPSPLEMAGPEEFSGVDMARRIADRRKRSGLTQAELAKRAGVRIETVNRIERGHVTPDFGTIRKLVQAMLEAEGAPRAVVSRNRKE